MQLQTGQELKHIESGAVAIYKAAIPTLGHGLIHLLVGPNGYLHKFTSELEADFEVPGTELAAPTVNDPLAGITAADVQSLLALLRAQGGTNAGAEQAPQPAAQEQVQEPAEPDLAKATPIQAAPVEEQAPAPSAGSGAIPL